MQLYTDLERLCSPVEQKLCDNTIWWDQKFIAINADVVFAAGEGRKGR